jgi:hypothetical protein
MSRISENVVASSSSNPKGLHGPYRDSFPFTTTGKYRLTSEAFWSEVLKRMFGLRGVEV